VCVLKVVGLRITYSGCVMTEHSLGDLLDPFALLHTVLMHFVFNTLRTGDANLHFLRFCITTVKDE
jgi:hypothetical protein